MREGSRPQSWVLLAGLLVCPAGWACPNCPTSQIVRASVLGDGFWVHLVMSVVPFLLIGALSAGLYRIGLPLGKVAPERDEEGPGAGI